MNPVLERKLRPIYDALDSRNYKNAVKLCNNVLKRKEDVQIVSVLKALALEKLGKFDEGLQICKEVSAQNPTDEQTLNTLALVYRAFGKHEDICALYETATQKNPKSEELLIGLFNSYVRTENFAKQKEIAMKLYKQFPHERYLLWSIMCTSLQARANGSQGAQLLQISQKMFEKLLDKIKDVEAFSIYLFILEQQQQYQEIIKLLTTNTKLMGLYKVEAERKQYLATTHVKVQQFQEANAVFKDLLENNNADDWANILSYLDTGFKKSDNNKKQFVDEARAFIQSLQTKESKDKIRGPFLAEIELESRVLSHLPSETSSQKIQKLIVDYFSKYSDRNACFGDLKAYLANPAVIPRDKATVNPLLDSLKSVIPADGEVLRVQEQNVSRWTTYYSIHRYLGASTLNDQKDEQVVQLSNTVFEVFTKSTQLVSMQKKEATEFNIGDNALLLTVHTLLGLATKYRDTNKFLHFQYLAEGLVISQYALKFSKYAYFIKILQMVMYSMLGAVRPCVLLFEELDIKHILLDTVSYILFDDCLRCGHHQEAEQLCGHLLSFHDENNKQTLEYAIRAFNQESYSRVPEFFDFRKRVDASHQAAVATVERQLLRLKCSNSLEQLESTIKALNIPVIKGYSSGETLPKLAINEDFKLLMNWDPESSTPSSSSNNNNNYDRTSTSNNAIHTNIFTALPKDATTSAEVITRPYNIQLKWLSLRSTVLLILHHIIAKQPTEAGEFIQKLEAGLNEFQLLNKNATAWTSFDSLHWSALTVLFQVSQKILAISSSLEKDTYTESDEPKQIQAALTSLKSLITMIKKHVTDNLALTLSDGTKVFNGYNVGPLSLFTAETLSWASLLLEFCNKLIPVPSKKKKAQPSPASTASELLRNLLKELQDQLKQDFVDIQSALTSEPATKTDTVHRLLDTTSLNIPFVGKEEAKEAMGVVMKNISGSYTYTIEVLKQIVEVRLNGLKALKM